MSKKIIYVTLRGEPAFPGGRTTRGPWGHRQAAVLGLSPVCPRILPPQFLRQPSWSGVGWGGKLLNEFLMLLRGFEPELNSTLDSSRNFGQTGKQMFKGRWKRSVGDTGLDLLG